MASLVECPLGCKAKFPLSAFHDHCALDCPFIEIPCPRGCGHKCQRQYMRDHIRQCMTQNSPYMSIGRVDSPPEERPRPQQLDFATRSASAPPSPIPQHRNVAPTIPVPETIDASSLRAVNSVMERGMDVWHQFEALFPLAVSWGKAAVSYWSRMRASDERAWLAGNLLLGIIVMYMFFTPFLFVLRCGVLAFVLYSCWNTISSSSVGQEQQYRGIVTTGFAVLAIYLIKMLL